MRLKLAGNNHISRRTHSRKVLQQAFEWFTFAFWRGEVTIRVPEKFAGVVAFAIEARATRQDWTLTEAIGPHIQEWVNLQAEANKTIK